MIKTFFLFLKNMTSFMQSKSLFNIISKIFTRSNLNKAIIIFTFGLTSRIFIYYFYNVNVFTEYSNYISLVYYSLFSLFIVTIHEVVNYFNVNIIPPFITDFFTHIVNLHTNNMKILKWIFDSLKSPFYTINILNWDNLKPSSIRKYINSIFTADSKALIGTDMPSKVSNTSYKDVPLIPNTLNMQGDFNLYDSDRNSDDLSSRSETSAYFPTSDRALPDNTPYTTTDNTPIKSNTKASASNNSSSNNNASSANNVPLLCTDNRMLFVVDTIKEHSDIESIGLQTPHSNNMPRAPLPSGFTTPSTMTPLFGNSRTPSMNSSYYNQPVTNESNHNGHEYPVPGQAPYFNPPRESLDSNKAVFGLNSSNENFWRNRFISGSDIQSTNWSQQRQIVDQGITQRYLESNEKEVVPSLINSVLPREVEVKRGIFGRIKLTFKLIDSKLDAKISNMDSIAIKLHDSSKRKFFWNIWEKKSGNYESYEDFKRSWDPKTNIWNEIKSRTNHDVRLDVEGLLGVGVNRPQLNSGTARGIQGSNLGVGTGVNQLIRERQPFTFTELNHEEAANTMEKQETHRSRNKSRRHRHHKHSSHSHTRRHNNR